MTDFELTRLAFKAAFSGTDLTEDMMRHWSPLTDDGDALRLAVKLRIGNLWAMQEWSRQDLQEANTAWISDPYAATRRAIVRAAAEIGKEKQNA